MLFQDNNKQKNQDNKNLDEIQILKHKLKEEQNINQENIKQINELKTLIKEYTSQLNLIKNTYKESNDTLINQINFERDVYGKYLKKIFDYNKSIDDEVKKFSIKSSFNSNSLTKYDQIETWDYRKYSQSNEKAVVVAPEVKNGQLNVGRYACTYAPIIDLNKDDITDYEVNIDFYYSSFYQLIGLSRVDIKEDEASWTDTIIRPQTYLGDGNHTYSRLTAKFIDGIAYYYINNKFTGKTYDYNNKKGIIYIIGYSSPALKNNNGLYIENVYTSKTNDNLDSIIKNLKTDLTDSKTEIINQISQSEPAQLESYEEKIQDLEKSITENNKKLLETISNNKNIADNRSSKVIDAISQNNPFDADSLIADIKKHTDDNNKKLVDLLSKNSANNEQISQLNDSTVKIAGIAEDLKTKNDELLNYVDFTKIEIFNKLSDDLRNNNYVNLKAYKKIKELGLFDEVFYKKEYDYNLDIDPLLHYIYKGYEENKEPSSDFNNLYYKSSDKNITESNLNPLVYFVTKGLKEGNIKINEDVKELNHINKYEIDEELSTFEYRGVKKSKRKPKIIVSLTTFPERINEVHYTLYSLLNQELKADKVILWLSKQDFPEEELDLPKDLLRLKTNGLSIRFCDDKKSLNKIIPSIKTYPNDIVVIADDDIYYPRDWLKILYEDHKRNPDYIIGHKSRRIDFDDKGNINSYSKWNSIEEEIEASSLNFMNGVAGVLYPPHSFKDEALSSDEYLELCEDADDLWLWAMAVLNNKEFKLAKNNIDSITYVNPARENKIIKQKTLGRNNLSNKENDIHLDNIIKKYPEILHILKENN